MYVAPSSMPRAVRIGKSRGDRWQRPKAKEEMPSAAHVGSHLVSDVSKKPRNTARRVWERGAGVSLTWVEIQAGLHWWRHGKQGYKGRYEGRGRGSTCCSHEGNH